MKSYTVVRDFQVKDRRVLVLDRAYECGNHSKLVSDGVEYIFTLNSIDNWVIIKSSQSFVGKKISFV